MLIWLMSVAMQVRRTTRTTRPVTRGIENANIKSTRMQTRSAAATEDDNSHRATAPTASSKAKTVDTTEAPVAGKRKREALAEVTEVNRERSPTKASTEGKRKNTNTTAVVKKAKARQPLQSIPNPRASQSSLQRTSAAGTTEEEACIVVERNAIEHVLPGSGPNRPVFKFVSRPRDSRAAPSRLPALQDIDAPRVFKKRHTLLQQVEGPSSENTDTAPPSVAKKPNPPIDSRPQVDETAQAREDDSAIAPLPASEGTRLEEERVASQLVAVEEDEDYFWDDFDAEDWDDPAMCAEYAVEVCNYWKELEVGAIRLFCYILLMNASLDKKPASPKLHSPPPPARLGQTRDSLGLVIPSPLLRPIQRRILLPLRECS